MSVKGAARDICDANTIRLALDECRDGKLYIAMNLAFACSLRMGEVLGLTQDNVHVTDDDIADDDAYIYVDKELSRCSKRAIEMIGDQDIFHIFTPLMPNTSTRLILKKPKTDSCIRKIWLPKTVAYIQSFNRRTEIKNINIRETTAGNFTAAAQDIEQALSYHKLVCFFFGYNHTLFRWAVYFIPQ